MKRKDDAPEWRKRKRNNNAQERIRTEERRMKRKVVQGCQMSRKRLARTPCCLKRLTQAADSNRSIRTHSPTDHQNTTPRI